MTDRADILALADEIEKLDAPSRKMDERIYLTLNPDSKWRSTVNGLDGELVTGNASTGKVAMITPNWTESIDAAVSLVPDGSYLRNMSLTGFGADEGEVWKVTINSTKPRAIHNGESAKLALAITAAVLRAIASEMS